MEVPKPSHPKAWRTHLRSGVLEPLLTADEVAEILGISRRRVYELRDFGLLRAHTIGRRTLRFAPSEIARLIEAGADLDSSP